MFYQEIGGGNPLDILIARDTRAHAIKALKLFKRTGRIDKASLEDVRALLTANSTVNAGAIQENLKAEFSGDEQFDGAQLDCEGARLCDISDQEVDRIVEFLTKKKEIKMTSRIAKSLALEHKVVSNWPEIVLVPAKKAAKSRKCMDKTSNDLIKLLKSGGAHK